MIETKYIVGDEVFDTLEEAQNYENKIGKINYHYQRIKVIREINRMKPLLSGLDRSYKEVKSKNIPFNTKFNKPDFESCYGNNIRCGMANRRFSSEFYFLDDLDSNGYFTLYSKEKLEYLNFNTKSFSNKEKNLLQDMVKFSYLRRLHITVEYYHKLKSELKFINNKIKEENENK